MLISNIPKYKNYLKNLTKKEKSEGKDMQKVANRVSLGAVHTHTHTQVRLEK